MNILLSLERNKFSQEGKRQGASPFAVLENKY